MKTLGAFLLVGAVVAFYLGYGPEDLVALWPAGGGSAPPSKVRRTAAPVEQTQPPAPPARNSGSSVVVNNPDGSLEHRWASPTKP